MAAPVLLLAALGWLLLSSTTTDAFVVGVLPPTVKTSPLLSPVSPLYQEQQHKQEQGRYAIQTTIESQTINEKKPFTKVDATPLDIIFPNCKWIPTMTAHRLPTSAAVSLASAALFLSTSFMTPLIAAPAPAHAAESKLIGQIAGSGLFFKDTLQIERFDDPKVQGVTLYISNFERPLTERLSTKDFLSDPSYASVSCVKTGPIKVADNIATGAGGEEVFEESRSLLFKTLRVQRITDADKNTVVYVSFNTRLDKNADSNKSRFKSSLCAVSLD